MKFYTLTLAAVMTLGLAACGDTRTERAVTGGAMGAGVGAAGSAVLGGNPWTGAAVGGAVGAGVGAMTDEDHFDD